MNEYFIIYHYYVFVLRYYLGISRKDQNIIELSAVQTQGNKTTMLFLSLLWAWNKTFGHLWLHVFYRIIQEEQDMGTLSLTFKNVSKEPFSMYSVTIITGLPGKNDD